MIDFRYHLVSIVAIFLALGLGIVLGSTALRPYVLGALEATSRQEHHQISELLTTQGQLARQINGDGQFAQAASAQLLTGLLSAQRVVLVEGPGAAGQVTDGVTQALQQAGATVSGQVQIQPKFFDSSSVTQAGLGELAQRLAPAGLTLRGGSAVAQAGQVLASAIMTNDGPNQPVPGQQDSTSKAILTGFTAGGFLSTSGLPWARATLAVVVIPGTPQSTSDTNASSQGLVTLAQQLNLAGQGTVVAGSITGSGPGSAIDVMRTAGRNGHLSSVDDADTPIGQVVVAQALIQQLNGVSGSYGVTATASTAGPSPAPTPSSSPSATVGAADTKRGTHPVPTPSRTGKR